MNYSVSTPDERKRELFWAELIWRLSPRLRAYASRTRCSEGEVEEILWDVWERAVGSEDTLRSCDDQWPIIAALLRAVCAERLRVWRREISFATSSVDGLPTTFPETNEQDEQDRWNAVAMAMQGLSTHQRLAVDFRYRWGWPYWGIAAAIDCDETTARVHVLRALRKLQTRVATVRSLSLEPQQRGPGSC